MYNESFLCRLSHPLELRVLDKSLIMLIFSFSYLIITKLPFDPISNC